jgi:hypothetical protein
LQKYAADNAQTSEQILNNDRAAQQAQIDALSKKFDQYNLNQDSYLQDRQNNVDNYNNTTTAAIDKLNKIDTDKMNINTNQNARALSQQLYDQ